ncbi:MAG: site-specific integrase, partial [Rikenellaceae bacterium]|nr:site-specific integrase [Rikenellaceae bacterium]
MQINDYLKYIEGVRRYSPRTQQIYRDVLESFSERGEALTTTGIRNYEVYLLDKKGKSARTVNLHLSVLSGYCRWAMKKGLMDSNPVKLVPKPKMDKRLPVFYREEAIKEYFAKTAHNADKEQLEFLKSLPLTDPTAKELYL